jgi:hypothetical protein
MKITLLLIIVPFICVAQSTVPDENLITHNRKIFELNITEGYAVHKNNSAQSMIFDNKIMPISKTGGDFKTQIKASIYPVKCISVGFIGSLMNLRYTVASNHKVNDASPLWQYGAFADYNQNIGHNLIIFGGGSYSLTKKEYSAVMIPQPPQNATSKNKYSLGLNAGIKYKIKGELNGIGSIEYSTMYFTNYVCINFGLSFRF